MLLTHQHLPSPLLIYRHTAGLQQQGIRGVGRWLDEADIMLSRLIELEGRWDVGAEIGFRNFLTASVSTSIYFNKARPGINREPQR